MSSRNSEPRALALGCSRYGGGPAQLLLLVLGSGLLAAIVLSTALSLLVEFQEGFWPAWINLTLTFWLIASAAAWFVLVDRKSLPKVVKNPEQTVEQSWRSRAQAAVYRDLCFVFVLGCSLSVLVYLLTDVMLSWPVLLVFIGLIWFSLLDYMIRYKLIKRAES